MSVDVRYAITPRSTQNAEAAGTSLDSAKMQTYANTSISVVDVDVRYNVVWNLLPIATWRGMETFLATILIHHKLKYTNKISNKIGSFTDRGQGEICRKDYCRHIIESYPSCTCSKASGVLELDT